MKKLLLAGVAASALAGAASAADVNIGVILGFTGPIESLTPGMAESAELAMKEVNDSGKFLDGASKLVSIRADSTCVDAAAATAAAERLVSSDNVAAIMGADCSGVTTAVATGVAIPAGVTMVSPSATSPALSALEDNGLFFRTAPSDARQGEVLTGILIDQGIKNVAVTFTNNDYGKGLADAFASNFLAAGGTITIQAAHEDGKADYSAEVAALAAAGGDVLVVLGYADQGGVGIIRNAVDTGAFTRFALGDGMYSDSLIAAIGPALDGTIGSVPWAEGEGNDAFVATATAAGVATEGSYRRESYDAAALIALAMQKAGNADRAGVAANMLDVANAPGEKILPGQLAHGLELIAAGTDIDYVGATNVELIGPGEAAGFYKEYVVKGGKYETVKFR